MLEFDILKKKNENDKIIFRRYWKILIKLVYQESRNPESEIQKELFKVKLKEKFKISLNKKNYELCTIR